MVPTVVVILQVIHRNINLTNHNLVLSEFIHVPDDENQSLCPQQVYGVDRSVKVRDQLLLPRQLLNLLIIRVSHSVSALAGA